LRGRASAGGCRQHRGNNYEQQNDPFHLILSWAKSHDILASAYDSQINPKAGQQFMDLTGHLSMCTVKEFGLEYGRLLQGQRMVSEHSCA
jgi:hypothetical protein